MLLGTLTQTYTGQINSLRSTVCVASAERPVAGEKISSIEIQAIWDTGATNSVITPNLKKALQLRSFSHQMIFGVNNESDAETTYISLTLPTKPNRAELDKLPVFVADINVAGVDMLIGMDVIMRGDFSISNGGRVGVFSLAMPSIPVTIDLTRFARPLLS
jgi:hypothetical protein